MIKLRQRKYRFWDLEEKKMIYPEEPDCLYLDCNGKVNYCEVIIDDLSETNRFVAMDWIGITDKNDKDIYELDIVNFYGLFYGKGEERIVLVQYAPRCTAFLFDEHPDAKSGWGLTFPDKDKYFYKGTKALFLEVIGNWYENPELLKKLKEA